MALDTISGVTYLYVSDQNNGRIIKYNLATGARIAAWGVRTGMAISSSTVPMAIAIDPSRTTCSSPNAATIAIQRITNQGVFVVMWGTKGTDNGYFDGPLGIAADASGNVYVTDHNNTASRNFTSAARSQPPHHLGRRRPRRGPVERARMASRSTRRTPCGSRTPSTTGCSASTPAAT